LRGFGWACFGEVSGVRYERRRGDCGLGDLSWSVLFSFLLSFLGVLDATSIRCLFLFSFERQCIAFGDVRSVAKERCTERIRVILN
jgi:hypothetical protein